MKSKEEIINIAKEHLIENPFPYSNYEWDLKEDFVELEKEYYFEYSFQPKKGLPPEQWQMSAGAPGFCINKLTGNVTDVNWSEYQDTILNG